MLWLRKRLRKNSKRSGANIVSMKDIAQRCSVSVATVSKALNGQPDIGPETRDRICAAAEEMGYVTNSAARALKANRTYNIGIPLRGRAEQRSDPCVFLLRAGKPEGGGREPGLRCDLHQPQCGPPHHLFAALPLPGCGRGDHRQCGFFRSPGAGAGEFRAACGHH